MPPLLTPGRLAVTLALAMLLLSVTVPAAPLEQEGAEVWETNYLIVRSVAYIHRNENKIFGVVYLFGLFGKTDVYHVQGIVNNGRIKAAHYTGHKFEGRMVSEQEVTGVVTTRNGHKFRITSHKRPTDDSSN